MGPLASPAMGNWGTCHGKGTAAPLPHSSVHVYCGQTAAWIRIPLGTEVGLVPDDIALDEDPAPPPTDRDTAAPLFGPCLLQPNGRPSQQLLSSCTNGRPKTWTQNWNQVTGSAISVGSLCQPRCLTWCPRFNMRIWRSTVLFAVNSTFTAAAKNWFF